MADIESMMAKVAALIANAESYQDQGNPEAAASYREKAETLMRKYRIEEEVLVREAVSSGVPVWKTVDLGRFDGQWQNELHRIFYAITEHCGVEYHLVGRGLNWEADVVGYEIDVRLCEMIFAAARLAFLARLDPTYDPTKTAVENIYALRGSGMDRQRVAKLVFGQEGHSQGLRVGQIFKAECARRGETDGVSGRGFNPMIYRNAYADEFCITIRRRLRDARDAADSVGGALVLPQRAERVREALYAKYPSERPMTAEERAAAKSEQEQWEKEHPEEAMRRAKAYEKANRWTAADQRRWDRANGTAALRAREAGRDAASSVDLVRGTSSPNRAGSSERPEIQG
jgi:hypothetical protein